MRDSTSINKRFATVTLVRSRGEKVVASATWLWVFLRIFANRYMSPFTKGDVSAYADIRKFTLVITFPSPAVYSDQN